ncbi:MAG: hypothetical protein KatS3mg002_0435 [Candidatus Woesearchaeota archaeon]|nr:MAG: hypothetical protein KatS3mg002_0435 [Candidatus Woesearchaeota archaeon]
MNVKKEIYNIVCDLDLEILKEIELMNNYSITTTECIIMYDPEEELINIAFHIAVEPGRAAAIATKLSHIGNVIVQDSYILDSQGNVLTGLKAIDELYTSITRKVLNIFVEEQKELHRFLFMTHGEG